MRFTDRQFAMEYDARLERENYPGELYRHVREGLEGLTRVLDVGAGTGFFAIPLAREGKKITAIEPSDEMIRLMVSKITPEIAANISVVHSDWETWSGAFSEALICVHSLYPMKNPAMALSLMKKRSAASLVVVRTLEGRMTLSDMIRKKLIPGHSSPDYTKIIRDHLERIGAPRTERFISETKAVIIDDIEQEAAYYSLQLFKNREHVAQIKKIIINSCELTGSSYLFTAHHHDILFTF